MSEKKDISLGDLLGAAKDAKSKSDKSRDQRIKKIRNSYTSVAIEYENGALFMSTNSSDFNKTPVYQHSTFEIYDNIAMSAAGEKKDYEKLRKLCIQKAAIESYTHSSKDVRLDSLIDSQVIPFMNPEGLTTKPPSLELLFTELAEEYDGRPVFHRLDIDGTHVYNGSFQFLNPLSKEGHQYLSSALAQIDFKDISLEEAKNLAFTGLFHAFGSDSESIQKTMEEYQNELIEIAVLDRTLPGRRKFRKISPTKEKKSKYLPAPSTMILNQTSDEQQVITDVIVAELKAQQEAIKAELKSDKSISKKNDNGSDNKLKSKTENNK